MVKCSHHVFAKTIRAIVERETKHYKTKVYRTTRPKRPFVDMPVSLQAGYCADTIRQFSKLYSQCTTFVTHFFQVNPPFFTKTWHTNRNGALEDGKGVISASPETRDSNFILSTLILYEEFSNCTFLALCDMETDMIMVQKWTVPEPQKRPPGCHQGGHCLHLGGRLLKP